MKVFALCHTYYQLAQVIGLCEWLRSKGIAPLLAIYRGRAVFDNPTINLSSLDFSHLSFPVTITDMPSSNIRQLPWAVGGLLVRSLQKNSSESLLVAPNGPHLGLLSALHSSGVRIDSFISMDEGIGTHCGIYHRARTRSRTSGRAHLFPKFLAGEGVKDILLQVMTLRSGGVIETVLPRRGWGKKIRIASYFKAALLSGIFRVSEAHLEKNSALFLSQPLVETGLLTIEQYCAFIQQLKSRVEEMGWELVIKPHPAEEVTKFNGRSLCLFDGPVEVLFAMNQETIAAIIGINSTSMIIGNGLFGIPTYRIKHPLLGRLNKKGKPRQLDLIIDQYSTLLALE